MPGIEPGAFHMQSERSTAELHPQLGEATAEHCSHEWNTRIWSTNQRIAWRETGRVWVNRLVPAVRLGWTEK
jgi:hypothetical protein